MTEYRKLTQEELGELAGEELPERAAMSLINANVAAPINAAVALNALSDNSAAIRERGADRRHRPVELAMTRASEAHP